MLARIATTPTVAPSRVRTTRTTTSTRTRVQPDGSGCAETAGAAMNVGRPIYNRISQKLTAALAPVTLNVIDESAMHAGHVGNPGKGDPSAETHFKVEIVSDAFKGMRQVARHRMVYEIIDEEMKGIAGLHIGVHALQLKTKTPEEV